MMHPEVRRQATRLFAALEYGEQLAHDCARQQACWIGTPRAQRFLNAQARQEAVHATFYRRAAEWLMPGHHYQAPKSLQQYGRRLQRALDKNDLCDSLTGSQIVLEGFGEQIITRLNRSMDNHGIGFRHLRRVLLRQEQSHYAFGLHMLQQQIASEPANSGRIQALAADYLQQVHAIIDEMSDVFISLDADPGEYRTDLLGKLPDWIRGPRA
jgi:ribonucleotide reductase beta subunit family protein with ferritin-like domain